MFLVLILYYHPSAVQITVFCLSLGVSLDFVNRRMGGVRSVNVKKTKSSKKMVQKIAMSLTLASVQKQGKSE